MYLGAKRRYINTLPFLSFTYLLTHIHCVYLLTLQQDVSHGETGRGQSPAFGVGDANANSPPSFWHVSKFQAPKHAIASEKFNNFFLEGAVPSRFPDSSSGRDTPSPHLSSRPRASHLDPTLRPAEFQTDLRLCFTGILASHSGVHWRV